MPASCFEADIRRATVRLPAIGSPKRPFAWFLNRLEGCAWPSLTDDRWRYDIFKM